MNSLRLDPMTEEQFQAYLDYGIRSFAESLAEAGTPMPEALEQARKSTADKLPDGLQTPEHHLWTAYDGDTEIGLLWLHIRERSDGLTAFGYDFLVHDTLRRKGYGRAIMQLAEQKCRDLGVVSIGLHVFAHNPGARSLYEQMGFEVKSYNMAKPL